MLKSSRAGEFSHVFLTIKCSDIGLIIPKYPKSIWSWEQMKHIRILWWILNKITSTRPSNIGLLWVTPWGRCTLRFIKLWLCWGAVAHPLSREASLDGVQNVSHRHWLSDISGSMFKAKLIVVLKSMSSNHEFPSHPVYILLQDLKMSEHLIESYRLL